MNGSHHRFSAGDLPSNAKDPTPTERKRCNTSPPKEERSAPEGTSSPTPPQPSESQQSKPRPLSAPDGYMTNKQVEELLKQQEKQFEEKLQRAGKVAGEKEKKLRETMKEEQKELGTIRNSMGELTTSRDALVKMVEQYKDMLSALVAEKEKEKQGQEERIKDLEVERNQSLQDLSNVEQAFTDVHRKYERTKQVVETLRRNEETLRKAVTDCETKLQNQEQKFTELHQIAEEKLHEANEEFEILRKNNEQEMAKMAALLKKAEMKIISLQEGLDRKTKENQELTQLCDDLINKMGPS